MESSRLSIESEILLRYSDWLFTTPLLLKVIASYYELSDAITCELIVYNVVMVVSGVLYESTGNIKFWIAGVVAYLMLIFRLRTELPELDLFYRYFVIGWGLYGVVALMPRANRLILYNLLDFYNKLVFAIDIRNRIEVDLHGREKSKLL